MNKLLTGVLMLCVLTGVAAAQPYRPTTQSTFSQWSENNKKNNSYMDWKKGFDKKVARQKAAAKKAFAAIPSKTKAHAQIMWWNDYEMLDGTSKSHNESYTCSVLLMDYHEKDGLGTVNVAFKNDCFKKMQKNALRDWFTFRVNLSQFNTAGQEESFAYQYSHNGDEAITKNLNAFKHVKIAGTDYYQFPMPVRTPALKNGFKKLFPTAKSFITAEKAALALKLMPGPSGITAAAQL